MADFERLERIFEEVVDLPPAQHAQRLDELCGDDAELRRKVEDLLRADLRSSWFLDQPLDAGQRLAVELEGGVEARLPERIGSFRVLRLLGEGGMGVVYEAEQDHPRRLVAVKCIHPWLHTPAMLERFQAEAQLMGQLLHPNIPQVYEAGECEGQLYLAMERVQGHDLHAWALPLSPRQRVLLLFSILDAVQHAHDHGVIHCDLKPANILVTTEGMPKVLDFGIASTRGKVEGGASVGTPHYMSPEQLRGDQAPTPAWDVYALGVLAFELLTGRHPYDIATRRRERILERLEQPPQPLDLGADLLSRDLEAVVLRAIATDPTRRYPTVARLRADLHRALEHRPVSARPSTPAYRATTWAVRNRRGLALAASPLVVVGLVLGGMAGWDGLTELRRERQATERWTAVEARIHELESQGDQAGAGAAWQAFVQDPAWQGTRSLSRAHLAHGERLSEEGRSQEARDSWVLAFSTAPDAELEVAALQALGGSFASEWRWDAVSAVVSSLAEHQVEAPDLALEAALGSRDLQRAQELMDQGDPRLPLLHTLSAGGPWEVDSHHLIQEDLDGDGRTEVFGAAGVYVDVWSPTRPFQRVDLPLQPDRAVWLGDRGVFLVQSPRAQRQVFLFPLREVWARGEQLESRLVLEEEALLEAAEADLDGDGIEEIYVGTGPYTRRLLRLDPDSQGGWTASSPHPGTDAAGSDLTALLVSDLDEDGRQELVVAATAWSAWDLRVLGADDTGSLRLEGRRAGSDSAAVRLVDSARGPRLFAVEVPRDGSPPRLVLLAWDGEDFREDWVGLLPLPAGAGSPGCGDSHAGDLDGDGLEDLAFSCSLDLDRYAYVLRALPEGGFVPLVLPRLMVTGVVDTDGDGVSELAVELDAPGEQWLLGRGDQALPRLQVAPKPRMEVPGGLERVAQLLAMGLEEEAASHAQAGAPSSADPAAALLLAASLWEDLDHRQEALSLYDQVLSLLPEEAEATVGRARMLEGLGRYEEAASAWRSVPAHPQTVAHLEALGPLLEDRPELLQDFTGDLEGWRVERPLALRHRRREGSLELEVLGGSGRLAWLPLDLRSQRLDLEVDLELDQPEMATLAQFSLVCDRAEPLVWGLGFGGGGGQTWRRVWVNREYGLRHLIQEEPAAPQRHQERLHLHLSHLRTSGLTELEVVSSLTGSQRFTQVLLPLPAGRCDLELSAEPVASYGSPMRMVLRLDRLRLQGLELAQDTVDTPLHRRLVAGEAASVLDQLPPEDLDARLAALVELGRLDQATEILAARLQEEDPYALVQLRHTDELLGTLLHQRLGDLWYDRWEQAYRSCLHHSDHPDCHAALDRSCFSSIPGHTHSQRLLLYHHARRMLEQGLLARAEADLSRLLEVTGEDEGDLLAWAWLAWADLGCARGDSEQHTLGLRRAVQTSPAPELVEDRLEDHACE